MTINKKQSKGVIIRKPTELSPKVSCHTVGFFIGYVIEKRSIRLGSSGASLFGLVAKL